MRSYLVYLVIMVGLMVLLVGKLQDMLAVNLQVLEGLAR